MPRVIDPSLTSDLATMTPLLLVLAAPLVVGVPLLLHPRLAHSPRQAYWTIILSTYAMAGLGWLVYSYVPARYTTDDQFTTLPVHPGTVTRYQTLREDLAAPAVLGQLVVAQRTSGLPPSEVFAIYDIGEKDARAFWNRWVEFMALTVIGLGFWMYGIGWRRRGRGMPNPSQAADGPASMI